MSPSIRMLFVTALVCLSLPAAGQEPIVQRFQARTHIHQGTVLPYRLFIPDPYDSTVAYPVVLALHGSGERGSDNISHIRANRLATAWADSTNPNLTPSFVVAPQCPLTRYWGEDSIAAAVISLLDSLLREFSIDTNRQYVTGLSMGGYGTWDLVRRLPQRFAAAVPMSAGADLSSLTPYLHLPIWNFHGALDDVVPVSESRYVIEALAQAGRSVVYTHCRYLDCRGMPDSVLATAVAAHSDLLYTEYQTGGHVIWDESYDHPLLIPWTFQQFRQIPGAIALTSFSSHVTVGGTQAITWTGGKAGDSVEIWFSPDAGSSGTRIAESAPNIGMYSWNTETVEDCAFGTLRILLKNPRGFAYARDESQFFSIDNPGSGRPFVRILNEEFRRGITVTEDTILLRVLLGDPDTGTLTVNLAYADGIARPFLPFMSLACQADTLPVIIAVPLASVPNSDAASLKILVSDGAAVVADSTWNFVKRNQRLPGEPPLHIAGNAGASVIVHVVDASQLTGHQYRVTFDDTSFAFKVYDVLDLATQTVVVNDAHPLDGIAEGPAFDGLRLTIRDYPQTVVDPLGTRWLTGSSTLTVAVVLAEIDTGGGVLRGFPRPADYSIVVSDQVVDTSLAMFGAPPVLMKFTIRNTTENRKVPVVYLDYDGDQTISLLDELYFFEPDSGGGLMLTWAMQFGGPPNATEPQPGDELRVATLKPLTRADVYEFAGVMAGVTESATPVAIRLLQNYPNPFNPQTEIAFSVATPAPTTLKVYSILGAEVATLFKGNADPGRTYVVRMDGRHLATGVYFYRLENGGTALTRKMLLLK